MGGEWWRAETLSDQAPYLPPQQRAPVVREALETARAIGAEWRRRAYVLTGLAPQLAESVILQRQSLAVAWMSTLAVLSRRPRPEFLRDLAALMPFVLALAGEEAPQVAQGIFEAIQDVCRWWP